MAAQNLSQAEVWDDSELLYSWNEAFEEYKVSTSVINLKTITDIGVEVPQLSSKRREGHPEG